MALSFIVYAQKTQLKFNNGNFKIVQLTDLHWVESENYKPANDSTRALIHQIIKVEKPDLVVITGDIVVSANAIKGWEALAKIFEEEKTPFAITFGNHDPESDMLKTDVMKFLKDKPYHLTYDAEQGLSGSGNCSLPVLSSDGASQKWILYFLDSHNLTTDRSFGYYDWIKLDQIDWYRKTSDEYTAKNHKKLPSLAFFHIPVPEYESARWVTSEFGERHEGACSPSINSGLFYAFIDKRDVIGTFVGHDHNNDYMVDFDGNIALAYGRKTGYPAAYTEILGRGARIIELHEDEAAFDTYIRDLKGTYTHYTFEQKNKGTNIPQFSGSFIQQSLVAGWDDARWDQEMAMLKEAGMKYLIYAPAYYINNEGKALASYPSSLVKKKDQKDIIEKCLKSAQKYGMKIFLGLNFNERWWKVDYDATWLIDQMKTGNKVADELTALYKGKYADAMYGWYWVWEVDNLNCMTADRQAILANALNTNLDHLSAITPDMPFMMSPFMNEKVGGNAKAYSEMWKNVFAQTHFRTGDIFSPQDCVGAGGVALNNLNDWFYELKQAVRTKPGLKFWGNVETFDQTYWVSSPLSRVQKQLETVNGYVSNIICFAYSHYTSPYVVDRNYHNTYLQYCKTGKMEASAPEKVQSAKLKKTSKGAEIVWVDAPNMASVSGYSIYKDGTLLKKIQVRQSHDLKKYVDENGSTANVYEIATYNVLGVESEKVKAEI